MEKLTDLIMTYLIRMAEFVCGKCSFYENEPSAPQSKPLASTIRFSNEDRMVEGDLFQNIVE